VYRFVPKYRTVRADSKNKSIKIKGLILVKAVLIRVQPITGWGGKIMRKSVQTNIWHDRLSVALPQFITILLLLAIASWSSHAHASSIWLWGWMGVANVQITQEGSDSPAPKSQKVAPAPKPLPPARTKMMGTKRPSIDDSCNRYLKDRVAKTAVM